MAITFSPVVIFMLYLTVTLVVALPASDEWMLPINRRVLHDIVVFSCPNRKSKSFDQSVANTVLIKILNSNGISEHDVDQPKLGQQLLKAVRVMLSKLKAENRKGGRNASNLLCKWKDSKLNLKFGGSKRRLEDDLSREKSVERSVKKKLQNRGKSSKQWKKKK
jgi:hypothetical protein